MFNIFKKLHKNRRIFSVAIFIVIIVMFLFNINYAMASVVGEAVTGTSNIALGVVGSAVTAVLGLIAYILTAVIGLLITVVVALLVQVAQYSNIINVPTVIEGWVIIRDLCNMLFILILLVVAFATILRIETYQWKKILPKLLIMAVLINFSRTIFGLLIDFSQIIMLTFVNAFSAGGGYFIKAFRIDLLLSVREVKGGGTTGDFAVTAWSTAIAIIAGVIAAIITLIVVSVMLAILVMRIIMLWIYTIFSPLVFMGFAVPAIQKYTSKIWEDFVKQLIVGPVLAFFIWLALTTASGSANLLAGQKLVAQEEVCVGAGAFFCGGNFQNFLIVIGLLMGGLMVAQQMGGAAGSIAGKGMDWAKKAPLALGGGAMFAGGWFGRKIKSGAISGLLADKTVDENGNVSWKGKGITGGIRGGLASALYGLEIRPTKIIQGIKEGIVSQAEKEEMQATGASAISLRRGGIGGLIKGLGVSRDLTESILGPGGIFWHKGFNRVIQATIKGGLKGVAKTEEELASLKAGRGVKQAEYDAKRREYDENLKKRDEALKYGDRVGAGKINETLNKLWPEVQSMRSKIVKDNVRDGQDKVIEKLDKKLSLRKPIQTFYADRAREELISKARQTMGDNDNEDALVEMFKDALANGNKEVAQAVMLHAAKVGHLNEVIQSYKSKRELKDERGNILVKKGGNLPQGGYGLHEVVRQALIEDLGMDEHTALATQSEASTLAKAIRHMNLAESVGTKNGFLIQRKIDGPGGQMDRARGEARKVDAEKFIRDYNRLGWGDEFMNASGGRDFKLNALGLDNFTELANVISKEIGPSGRMNKNAAMNIAGDAETLMNWAEELEIKGMKYYDAKNAGEKGDYMHSYVKLAEDLIKFGNNVRQAQGKTEVSEGIKELQTKVLNKQTRPT